MNIGVLAGLAAVALALSLMPGAALADGGAQPGAGGGGDAPGTFESVLGNFGTVTRESNDPMERAPPAFPAGRPGWRPTVPCPNWTPSSTQACRRTTKGCRCRRAAQPPRT